MSVPFDRTAELVGRALDVKGRSLWEDARRRLFRNRAAVVSIITLGIITLLAVFGPFFLAYPYDYIDYSVVSCAPDWWPDPSVLCNAGGTHWFGTDSVGRDLRDPAEPSCGHPLCGA